MDNRLTRWVYDHSPDLLQNLFVSAAGLSRRIQRYNRHQAEFEEFFRSTVTWSRSELEAYQDEKVRETVASAWRHVPYYRSQMDALGLRPSDIRGVEDLPKLPLLDKATLRDEGARILNRDVPRREWFSAVTSGSTGTPLRIYRTRRAESREYGFHWARRRPGVSRGESYGSFAGLELMSPSRMTPPFWRFNAAANQTVYSIFHINPSTVPRYLEHLERKAHRWLEGYPSVVAILAKAVLESGRTWPCPPAAMFTEAEELLDEHRSWIEHGFRTRVHNQYGMDEKCGSVTEYECGHLHYDMDYGVIEFLPVSEDVDGTVVEMVCTAFDNELMPLIRYRVGDLALLGPDTGACADRVSPVIRRIVGRTGHTLITGDGRLIRNVSVIFKKCRNIDLGQCVQEEPGVVRIRIVKAPGYTKADEIHLLEEFGRKMGAMEFEVEYVKGAEGLERTGRGKFLSIVSRVPPATLASSDVPADPRQDQARL